MSLFYYSLPSSQFLAIEKLTVGRTTLVQLALVSELGLGKLHSSLLLSLLRPIAQQVGSTNLPYLFFYDFRFVKEMHRMHFSQVLSLQNGNFVIQSSSLSTIAHGSTPLSGSPHQQINCVDQMSPLHTLSSSDIQQKANGLLIMGSNLGKPITDNTIEVMINLIIFYHPYFTGNFMKGCTNCSFLQRFTIGFVNCWRDRPVLAPVWQSELSWCFHLKDYRKFTRSFITTIESW